MKDLATILAAADRLAQSNEPAVLVTLVRTQGSTYRKPGARMLVLPGCRTIGTISGGCLEASVARQAWDETKKANRILFTINTTAEDDDWSPSTGCHGKLFLLAETIPAGRRHSTLHFIQESHHSSRLAIILHRFDRAADDTLTPQHTFLHSETSQLQDHLATLSPIHSLTRSQWLDHPQTPAFLEILPPPPHLLICGAGDDARPLVRFASELAWQITIVDSRERLATRERFPDAHMISAGGPDAVPALVKPNTAAVIMSHRFADDAAYLAKLLPLDLPYLGQLGPRARTDRLLEKIGTAFPSPAKNFRAPAGVPLGIAHTPESIALSIVTEIHSVLCNDLQ